MIATMEKGLNTDKRIKSAASLVMVVDGQDQIETYGF